ncbi:MAG: ABC transporter permease [Chloroflexi bacterium]|nr:ABC transporter permease [Chloroflexota bacterium]
MAAVTETKGQVASLKIERPKAESLTRIALRRFLRHRMAVFGVFLLSSVLLFCTLGMAFYSEGFANQPYPEKAFNPPSAEHIFGTDQVGRDVLARMIYGGQISLMIGITAITIAITIGTTVGLITGYVAGGKLGWIDSLLMRFVEALLAFPILVLLLLLSKWLAANTSTVNILGREISATVVNIVMLIGLTGWMGLSRIVRALVLSLKEREFITAARTIGASDARILIQHILPNCIAPIMVTATLGVGGAIVTESYLSFLGFGVQPPTATWGNIMERVRNSFDEAWWLWVTPGTFTVITVLAINFIGDGLRDALDPRNIK